MAERGGRAGKWIGIAVVVAGLAGVLCCGGLFLGVKMTLESTANVKGSGTVVSETREVEEFDEVAFQALSRLAVEITVGGTRSVTVEADDNVVPILTTEVVEGALVIGSLDSFKSDHARVVIVVPNLQGVSMEGAAKMDVIGIVCERFELTFAGAGDFSAAGKADHVKARLAGAGEVDLGQLVAQSVDVQADGAWDVRVHATESLDVGIDGAGSVEYEGDPKKVTQEINGVGSVKPR